MTIILFCCFLKKSRGPHRCLWWAALCPPCLKASRQAANKYVCLRVMNPKITEASYKLGHLLTCNMEPYSDDEIMNQTEVGIFLYLRKAQGNKRNALLQSGTAQRN